MSDPGQRLVHAAIAAGLRVEVMPGPSAVLTALAGFRLADRSLLFRRLSARTRKASATRNSAPAMERDCTSIYFESPYRLVDTLGMIAARLPAHPVVVARELTKMFEEFQRGPAQSVLEHYQDSLPKARSPCSSLPTNSPTG